MASGLTTGAMGWSSMMSSSDVEITNPAPTSY
jgi:hypothetical protein